MRRSISGVDLVVGALPKTAGPSPVPFIVSSRTLDHRLKIAVIAHLKYPIAEPFFGGLETHTHSLVSKLAARGHEVTLFAAEGSCATRLEEFTAADRSD